MDDCPTVIIGIPCLQFYWILQNKFFLSTPGKLKPASAFMSGKMKLQGDMGKALKLEKVMGQMKSRSYHTMMPNHQRGKL